MKKIVALLMLCASFAFASINLQTATKDELMSIKGVGDKKADQIIEYRKTNKIKSAEDLKNIKGFGNSIVSNINKMNKVSNKDIIDASKDKAIKTLTK